MSQSTWVELEILITTLEGRTIFCHPQVHEAPDLGSSIKALIVSQNDFAVWGYFLLSAVPKKTPVKKKNSQVKRNWSEMKGLKLE